MGAWLRKIQESDNRTKMRAAIGLTVLSMTIVIIVWLFYFDTLATFGNQPARVEEAKTDEFSLWGSVKNGTALMFENVKQGVSNVTKRFTGEKQYDVVPDSVQSEN